MLISVHWQTGFPFSDSLIIIICGSYYSSKKRNALLALPLHCKILNFFFRPSLTLPLYRKKVQPLTLLDTFFDKKVTPFVLLLKSGASVTYLKYQTRKVLSTESARVQRNLCLIAGVGEFCYQAVEYFSEVFWDIQFTEEL